MSGGCDFHGSLQGDCIHCLGFELAIARREIGRLHDWTRQLIESQAPPTCLVEISGIGDVALRCSLVAGHIGQHRTSDGALFTIDPDWAAT